MNVYSDGTFFDGVGEEYVPAFKQLTLPTYIQTVRQQLFGTSPDRTMLNYRVRQLLALVHSTPLVEHLTALDPRITYELEGEDWPDELFLPQTTLIAGTDEDAITILGRPAVPDVIGRCYHVYDVDVLTSSTAEVSRRTPPPQMWILDYALEDGLTTSMLLNGSGHSFKLATANVGQKWRIGILNRPQFDPAQLAANLGQIGEPSLNALFGITAQEPYATFRNLWQRKRELPLKLGALVCALVYRTEERRLGNA